MADFLTLQRMHGFDMNYLRKLTTSAITTPVIKERNRSNVCGVSGPEQPVHARTHAQLEKATIVHDCSPSLIKNLRECTLWEARVMSHGVPELYTASCRMHHLPPLKHIFDKKPRGKLLFSIGQRGCADREFHYPRGVAVDQSTGEVYVADSLNNRIHRYTGCGISLGYLGLVGKGLSQGRFDQPTGVTVAVVEATSKREILVADRKNKRVQRLDADIAEYTKGEYRVSIVTEGEPYCSAYDPVHDCVAVGCVHRTVELLRRKPETDDIPHKLHCFTLPNHCGVPHAARMCPISIDLDITRNHIVVTDSLTARVDYYTYDGRHAGGFTPVCGQADETICCLPSAVVVLDGGDQLAVADGLNRTVNIYDRRLRAEGRPARKVLSALDYLGNVQALAIGPEGHVVCAEFAANGPHCIQVFQDKDCMCHRGRLKADRPLPPPTIVCDTDEKPTAPSCEKREHNLL